MYESRPVGQHGAGTVKGTASPKADSKARLYLHARQKGFPNTKKKSFKIKFTR